LSLQLSLVLIQRHLRGLQYILFLATLHAFGSFRPEDLPQRHRGEADQGQPEQSKQDLDRHADQLHADEREEHDHDSNQNQLQKFHTGPLFRLQGIEHFLETDFSLSVARIEGGQTKVCPTTIYRTSKTSSACGILPNGAETCTPCA